MQDSGQCRIGFKVSSGARNRDLRSRSNVAVALTSPLKHPDKPAASAAKAAGPLGEKAVKGIVWLLVQTLSTKFLSLGTQLTLAWFLAKEDFGLIGLAFTVTAFVSVFQEAGLKDVLVHRNDRFDRWANAAFWMSAFLGLTGMAATIASAPIAAALYGEARLFGVLLMLSTISPIAGLMAVPQAQLANRLAFRALSRIGIVSALAGAFLSCLLASAGFGAYAIASGFVCSTTVRLFLLWGAAPYKPKRRLQLNRWKFLANDSFVMLITGVLLTCVFQGDYIALGLFHDSEVVGLYYFAFSLSAQAVGLFTNNLTQVLFPTLALLKNEPGRQAAAFLRSSKLLALACVPFCLAQAALADPVITLAFPERWHDATPILQVLSIGMAMRSVGSPGGSMMKSQGRFGSIFVVTAVYSVVFMLTVLLAAAYGGAVTVALAASACFLVVGPINLYVALPASHRSWRAIWGIYAGPLLATAGVAGALAGPMLLLDDSTGGHLCRMAVVGFVGLPLYVLLIRWLCPQQTLDAAARMRPLLARASSRFGLT